MSENKLAIISDIHANRWALEAVLKDIQQRGVKAIVNLGDSLYGPLDPAGTADLLIPLNLPTVSGNEDRALLEPVKEGAQSPSIAFSRACLQPQHLAWLGNLEKTKVVYDDFFLCHGAPSQDNVYLLVDVTEAGVVLKSNDDIVHLAAGVTQTVVLCGHDHTPRCLWAEGKLFVNPGSVGLPAYTDRLPYPHRIETGSPHARYSLVYRRSGGWWVEQIAVPYDWETAATTAARNDRLDWAVWLRSGRTS